MHKKIVAIAILAAVAYDTPRQRAHAEATARPYDSQPAGKCVGCGCPDNTDTPTPTTPTSGQEVPQTKPDPDQPAPKQKPAPKPEPAPAPTPPSGGAWSPGADCDQGGGGTKPPCNPSAPATTPKP